MPITTYPYADAYLARHVTPAREEQAIREVAMSGTFPGDWTQRLVVLRAYIVTCQECQQSSEDTFATKLASYRKDYADTLPQARAAQQAALEEAGTVSQGGGGIFSIDLQRS